MQQGLFFEQMRQESTIFILFRFFLPKKLFRFPAKNPQELEKFQLYIFALN